MARWEFKLPDIGEGITEGEIVAWRVSPGDAVKEDQPVVEIMTDKATVTITAPKAGTVVETRGRVGELVPVHDVLVVFELDRPWRRGTPAADSGPASDATQVSSGQSNGTTAHAAGSGALESQAARSPGPGVDPMAEVELDDSGPGVPGGVDEAAGPGGVHEAAGPGGVDEAAARSGGYFNDRPLATPATRKMARDQSIDLRQVPPTGPQGRVTLADVDAFARQDPVGKAPDDAGPEEKSPVPGRPAGRGGTEIGLATPPAADERIPVVGLRRRIAQKMAQAKRTAAHFTFVEECDATALKNARDRLKTDAAARGVKLSFLPFIVKAVVASLRRHPALNAMLDEAANEIVLKKTYNIGIATATDAGLLVPVVKNADRKSILSIATEIERLAADARAGKTRLEDLQGSTFTITSLGARSGLLATPIINFPEVAILGVHQIKEKPVVRSGQIVIGEVMLLSLSFDHRVVDGHVGAAFAYELIGYLEQPERLLLELV